MRMPKRQCFSCSLFDIQPKQVKPFGSVCLVLASLFRCYYFGWAINRIQRPTFVALWPWPIITGIYCKLSWWTVHNCFPSEGQAFQISHLPQEAVCCPWTYRVGRCTVHRCVCVCVCVRACVRACVYVHTHIYIYIRVQCAIDKSIARWTLFTFVIHIF